LRSKLVITTLGAQVMAATCKDLAATIHENRGIAALAYTI
jgi:hypothetical protein